jgi:hypothetical protein
MKAALGEMLLSWSLAAWNGGSLARIPALLYGDLDFAFPPKPDGS